MQPSDGLQHQKNTVYGLIKKIIEKMYGNNRLVTDFKEKYQLFNFQFQNNILYWNILVLLIFLEINKIADNILDKEGYL